MNGKKRGGKNGRTKETGALLRREKLFPRSVFQQELVTAIIISMIQSSFLTYRRIREISLLLMWNVIGC